MRKETYFDGEMLRDRRTCLPYVSDRLDFNSVTFTVDAVLDHLRPQGAFGSLILRCYRKWLNQRAPSRYCDPKMAELWREHQFKKVTHYLNHLSQIMLDKEPNY
jgi:hypothetical protein